VKLEIRSNWRIIIFESKWAGFMRGQNSAGKHSCGSGRWGIPPRWDGVYMKFRSSLPKMMLLKLMPDSLESPPKLFTAPLRKLLSEHFLSATSTPTNNQVHHRLVLFFSSPREHFMMRSSNPSNIL